MLIWLGLPASEISLPIEPFISVGGGILIALVSGGFGLLSIWLNKRLNRLDNHASPDPGVKAALARIERDLGGIRGDLRGTNGRLDNLTERFNAHTEQRR